MGKKHQLIAMDMGIDTHQEPVVYMRSDCHICRAEGFTANSRVTVEFGGRQLIATLNVVEQYVLPQHHIGFSFVAFKRLGVATGDRVRIKHVPLISSVSAVRKKIYGHELSDVEIRSVIADINTHRYSDIEIASFLSVCVGDRLSCDEVISLTRAMVDCGKRLSWPGHERIFDKHCIGGLPGNRTTPLVVAIVSAAGLVIPKTSSRAITSPAGTADVMETLTNIDLNLDEIQTVVAKTGACLAWGGAVNLSPVDEVLIRVERALELDGEGQLIASVLSKKIAAGSTHVLIDIPVGDTAKVRTQQDAERIAALFNRVGCALDIEVRCIISDGSRPVGRGIGPVEEIRDVLAVLNSHDDAPKDLRQRALNLAAQLLDFAGDQGIKEAMSTAIYLLDSGKAWQQFQRIVAEQGGFKPLPVAKHRSIQYAQHSGTICNIDNRRLARLAKLAGAPGEACAGLRLHVNVGDTVKQAAPLFTLYTESLGERDYALSYYRDNANMFEIGE
ncbi:thymidine phosphorylase family protein [Photobacterium sp. SDRW27]|uniref:thymidine phosphorylase family protein n=1 Tax=Photobacterium obscurum TaxID=2829490 RepID=UPI0022438A70|nr:thymidine phosphorylase family protein [Photobacterium obscurum]MCW8328609.1 thymidine phosphorylase family protein [Photobacterium obscurum]